MAHPLVEQLQDACASQTASLYFIRQVVDAGQQYLQAEQTLMVSCLELGSKAVTGSSAPKL